MFKRTMLFALASILMLFLGGCGGGETPQQASQPEATPPPSKPAEPPPAIYELTKDDITSHPDWTSGNISIPPFNLNFLAPSPERLQNAHAELFHLQGIRFAPACRAGLDRGKHKFIRERKALPADGQGLDLDLREIPLR